MADLTQGAQNQQGNLPEQITNNNWFGPPTPDDVAKIPDLNIGGNFEENTDDDIYQSKYKFDYLTFPTDLGMNYYGHYMLININVPTKGFSLGGSVSQDYAGDFTNRFEKLSTNDVSTVDQLRFGKGKSFAGGNRAGFSIPRQTRRIADSIALFMPNGLNFDSGNTYEPITLAEAAAGIAGGPIGRNIYNSDFIQRGAQLGRNPLNPGIEVVYITTPLRTFNFIFLFAPKSEQESFHLENIIKTIRFHSAPELNSSKTGAYFGLTWIPPAEFDIQFFNKGVENRHMPRINTCVLDRISLDYNPIGGYYSTFTNGYPVAVQMTLSFTELEPIHKERVIQGIY